MRAKLFALSANLSPGVCNREVMDDDELITRLAGGDDTALRELFTRHALMLAARLRTVLPPSDVEDVLQETFLAAWKGAGSYRSEEKAGAWLWGIARRQAALVLRRRRQSASTTISNCDCSCWRSASMKRPTGPN